MRLQDLSPEDIEAIDRAGDAYMNRFLEAAPAKGPFENMTERNYANAFLSWLVCGIADGGNIICREKQVHVVFDDRLYEAFKGTVRELCRHRGSELPDDAIDAISEESWRRGLGLEDLHFDSVMDAMYYYVDDYMMLLMPPLRLSTNGPMEGICAAGVLSWKRAVENKDDVGLPESLIPAQYTDDMFVRDVVAVSRRYGSDKPRREVIEIAEDRLSRYYRRERAAAKLQTEGQPLSEAAQAWLDRIADSYTESCIKAYGYEGKFAENTRKYLPALIRGTMTVDDVARAVGIGIYGSAKEDV